MSSLLKIEELEIMNSKNTEFNAKVAIIADYLDCIPSEVSDRIKLTSILCKLNNNKALAKLRQKLQTQATLCVVHCSK